MSDDKPAVWGRLACGCVDFCHGHGENALKASRDYTAMVNRGEIKTLEQLFHTYHLDTATGNALDALSPFPRKRGETDADFRQRIRTPAVPKPRLRLHMRTTTLTFTQKVHWCVELMGCDRRTTWLPTETEAYDHVRRGKFDYCVSTDRRRDGRLYG